MKYAMGLGNGREKADNLRDIFVQMRIKRRR